MRSGFYAKGYSECRKKKSCISFKVNKVQQQVVENYSRSSGSRGWTAVK